MTGFTVTERRGIVEGTFQIKKYEEKEEDGGKIAKDVGSQIWKGRYICTRKIRSKCQTNSGSLNTIVPLKRPPNY